MAIFALVIALADTKNGWRIFRWQTANCVGVCLFVANCNHFIWQNKDYFVVNLRKFCLEIWVRLPQFCTLNFNLKYLGNSLGIFLCNKKHKDCPSFVDNKCYIGV